MLMFSLINPLGLSYEHSRFSYSLNCLNDLVKLCNQPN